MNYERLVSAFVKSERLKSGLKYAEFAEKIGISHTSLSRIESCQQSVTLKTLQLIMGRLRASLVDIFGEEEVQRRHGRRG